MVMVESISQVDFGTLKDDWFVCLLNYTTLATLVRFIGLK